MIRPSIGESAHISLLISISGRVINPTHPLNRMRKTKQHHIVWHFELSATSAHTKAHYKSTNMPKHMVPIFGDAFSVPKLGVCFSGIRTRPLCWTWRLRGDNAKLVNNKGVQIKYLLTARLLILGELLFGVWRYLQSEIFFWRNWCMSNNVEVVVKFGR